MAYKNLMNELNKISAMVKKKIETSGGFTAFVIAYTSQGNYLAHFEPGPTEVERERAYGEMTDWLKKQSPYMFMFGKQTIRRQYKNKMDLMRNTNYIDLNYVLVIAKTPESTHCLSIEYTLKDGKYTFNDQLTDETDNEANKFLNKVYGNLN